MKKLALLIPALLFPFATHAAPALTTYTVSPNTIYPGAGDGSATTSTITMKFSEQVKVSLRIVNSGGEVVRSLYSSSGVTNPTPKIWNGTSDADALLPTGTYSVLIQATSTASGLTLVDFSKTITIGAENDPGAQTEDASAANPAPDSSMQGISTGELPAFLPVPALRLSLSVSRIVSAGADTAFSATVYDGAGQKRSDAVVTWIFGDGREQTGASVLHEFYEPGEYAVVVRATTDDGGEALEQISVEAEASAVRIAGVTIRGIALKNPGQRALDLSYWRLRVGEAEFKFPENTEILPGHTVIFPPQITGLGSANSAELLFPSGEVADSFPHSAAAQPAAQAVSYQKVQTVPVISQEVNGYVAKAVVAPAAASELAAAGAPLPAASTTGAASKKGLLRSPWSYGALGVLMAAGAALLVL